MFYLHRIAYSICHEVVVTPDDVIDHINGDKTDNRITNLRKVTHSENNLNRKYKSNISGCVGVGYYKHGKKPWQVRLGKTYLGCYETIEEALEVRKMAEEERGGFFRT
jgi:hypothetical protein